MCIFSRPVNSVKNTKIFARFSGVGTQFLAYQMSYDSQEKNAMILPIPVKQPVTESALKFIDMKEYDHFFEDLERCFPLVLSKRAKDSKSKSKGSLKVFKIGNYVASFVPTLEDFGRLDSQFRLPKSTWQQIPGYGDYGFAVFQLANGSLKPHPMAFEFATSSKELFFPTIHIHDGEVHESEQFDHVLYMQHAGFDSKVRRYQNRNIVDKGTGFVRSKYRASEVCDVEKARGLIAENLLVHKQTLRGKLPNKDVLIPVYGDPVRLSSSPLFWLSWAPWLIIPAGLTWFLIRRSKLKKNKTKEEILNDPKEKQN